jgi:hypothetical protein
VRRLICDSAAPTRPGSPTRKLPSWWKAIGRERPPDASYRLNPADVAELIDSYRAGAQANELERPFGVYRHTVTALLRRHGVAIRRVGLSPNQVAEACRLYCEGCSLARLAERFGIAGMTIRRCLPMAGVVMRSPNAPRSLSDRHQD